MRGKQRYRCRACGLNFTDTPPRGMPPAIKAVAVLLYVSGLSMNRTAKLLGVSTPSVMTWIEQFAKEHAPKPEPEEAPDEDTPRLGAWLELRAENPEALMQSAVDAGLTQVQHAGHPYYFMAPGGQVFTIAPQT